MISRSEQDKRKKYGPHENGTFCDTYLDTSVRQYISGPRLQSTICNTYLFSRTPACKAQRFIEKRRQAKQNQKKGKPGIHCLSALFFTITERTFSLNLLYVSAPD